MTKQLETIKLGMYYCSGYDTRIENGKPRHYTSGSGPTSPSFVVSCSETNIQEHMNFMESFMSDATQFRRFMNGLEGVLQTFAKKRPGYEFEARVSIELTRSELEVKP